MNNEKWKIYQQMQCRPGGMTPLVRTPKGIKENIGVMPSSMSGEAIEDVNYVIDIFNPQHILIVGIGRGDELKLMVEKGRNVKALTICKKEKENLKPEELQNKVDVGDIHDTNYQNGEFDFIFMRQTIEHLISPYIALMEIRRITTMNGHIFITTPSMESCFSDWHLYVFNPQQWRELFRKLGFRLDDVIYTQDNIGYTTKFTLTKTPMNDKSIHKWVETEINKIGGD